MAKDDALRILRPLAAALLMVAVVWSILLAPHEEWDFALLGFFTASAILAERFVIETEDAALTGSFIGIVLALVLLGPVQAALASVLATLAAYIQFRHWKTLACDLPGYTLFPLVAGSLGHLVDQFVQSPSDLALYAVGVYAVAVLTLYFIFATLTAPDHR